MGADWIAALRVYLGAAVLGNLAWELAPLPLYTLWQTATPGALGFAVLHCTGGDILIALTSLMLALVLAGNVAWPDCHFRRVATLTIVFGVSYTVFSEWLNVTVRHTWAMPIACRSFRASALACLRLSNGW